MKPPLRLAIVGTGEIAGKHAAAITAAEGAELAAVWGRDPGRTAEFADRHGVAAAADLEALAARPDIDGATIATPSGTHAACAMPFLVRGKAVLCEKPLDVTLPKIDSMLAAAERHGAVLSAVLQLRVGTGARALRQAVKSGRFGRLAMASARIKWWRGQDYYDSVAWRGTHALDGGGALMNQGIHAVDLLQWIAGMPCEIFAYSACVAHERIEVEDNLVAVLRYPHGMTGVLEASTACHPGFAMRIEVAGDRGSAILEDDRIIFWEFADPAPGDEEIRSMPAGLITGGSRDPRAIGIEGHRLLVEDLVQAVRDKRPPLIPGAEARSSVQLILSAYESARIGQPVRIRATAGH